MSVYIKLKQGLEKFFSSYYFIGFFALAMGFCWHIQNEYLASIIMTISIVLIFLTQTHVDALVPVLCMFQTFIYVGLGENLKASHFILIGILSTFILASIIFYFVKNRKFNYGKFKLGKLFIGLFAVAIAVAFGGLGYESLSLGFVFISFGFVVLVALIYMLLLNRTSDKFKNFVCLSLIAFGILVVYQFLITAVRCDDIKFAIAEKILDLGWATPNAIAIIMAFILPVCAYMATQSKSPILYIIPMVIFAVLGLLMQSRGVTVILAIEVPILLLLLICCSKNKFQSIICTGFLLCIVTILAMSIDLSIFYESLKRYGLDDNGRFRDWQYFYDLYTTNKNFGIGFFGSGGTNHVGPLNKVHSTIFQIWFCTGIVGTCLFAVHYVQRYLLFLTKPNKFKLFMLLSLLAFELYGLIDMTLLMYYLMIALFAVFVACEKETYILCGNTKKGIKVMENNQELNEITTEQSETTQQPAVEETVQQSQKPKRKVKHKLYRYFFKRFFDIVLSGLALIILSPVFLVLSIIVRIKHGSPVLFKHPRPGKNNKIFMFAKYRSMIDAYDEKGNLLPDDQRITKFGKMLRKTSLDELPQLWSIFKGDMSIVGPRPKLVQDMVFYNEEQNRRSEVRPGLTGLAQANGRNLNSWAETFKYDIYYVDNCSLWLDIKIIFKTAIKMIKRAEIADTNATADHYHYGKHLLYNNIITQEEYDQKIEESRQIMIANNFVPKISVVNDKIDEQKTAENK